YTRLCHTMTRLGEPVAPLFLARFALLAMARLDDAPAVLQMIDDAAADLGAARPG
ncbi:MAG: hypothetical protein RL260_3069, partial [Pseudomonadota bacterium]